MVTALFANPGQTVSVFVQVVDGYGRRTDGYAAPTIDFIRLPSGSNSGGYPVAMVPVVTGLFRHTFTIPSGAAGLGTYLISASYPHPVTAYPQYEIFILHVAAPFGASTVSPA